MKAYYLIALSFLVLVFSGCEKENLENIEDVFLTDVHVKNGTLHFPTGDAFLNALTEVNNTRPEEVIAWEIKNNYKSQFRVHAELLEEYNDASLEESKELERQFGNLFDFTSEDGIIPKIQAKGVMPLVNEFGLVYIEDNIYFFNEEGEFTARNKNDLEELIRTRITYPEKGIFYYPNVREDNYRTACGIFQTITVINDDEDRKGTITAQIEFYFIDLGREGYRATSYVRVNGTPLKKNFWGNWVNYKTNNTLNIDCELETFGYTLPKPGNVLFEDYIHNHNSNNYWTGIQYLEKVVDADGLLAMHQGYYQCFYVYMDPNEYKSQGAPWAIIECQQ